MIGLSLSNSLPSSTLSAHLIPTSTYHAPPVNLRLKGLDWHRKTRRRVVTRTGPPSTTSYIFAFVFPLSLLAVTIFTSVRVADKLDQKLFEEENGILEEYQLADDGVHQARLAGQSFLKELSEKQIGLEKVRIRYSPFSRTVHTAKVVASVLNIPFEGPQCQAIREIRERFFGSYELLSHDKYHDIWALDENDPFIPPEGGESVADVVIRLTRALTIIESEFSDCAVLVISHGDTLQILQSILNAVEEHRERPGDQDLASRIKAVSVTSVLSQHRKFALNTGELRALV